jgi:hypothetical protein
MVAILQDDRFSIQNLHVFRQCSNQRKYLITSFKKMSMKSPCKIEDKTADSCATVPLSVQQITMKTSGR